MPTLALHQLRVAAVAKCILSAMQVENPAVISACLLHDMGNIIKFRLTDFPEFLEPQGLDYWEGVKADMIQRYGPDEHAATYAIAQEIGVSAETMAYVDAIGFSKSIDNLEASVMHKICAYADMRVTPSGVASLASRFEDGRRRYADRTDRKLLDIERMEALYAAAYQIENAIFAGLILRPDQIDDVRIAPDLTLLQTFEVV